VSIKGRPIISARQVANANLKKIPSAMLGNNQHLNKVGARQKGTRYRMARSLLSSEE
jgi:hypothetical protein